MVIEVGALYLAIGVGCAAVSLSSPPRRALDAVLLVGLWPLVGPLLLGRLDAPAREHGEHDDLAARATAARARLAELDRALAAPPLDLEAAVARVAELERSGAERALAAARRREQSIRRLVGQRKQLADELEALAELLAQLQTQSEIVRLTGAADIDGEPVADLIADIEARLFGLEQLFEDRR